MNVSDVRPRLSRRTVFVDRRPAPGRTARALTHGPFRQPIWKTFFKE
jgi:hypothetical protein